MSINIPKLDSHYYLFIGDMLFHNVTQFWCCFISDGRDRLYVEASVVSVSLLVFILEILYRRCVLAPLPYNNENTDSRSIAFEYISNIFRPFI